LYDLINDRGEKNNIISQHPEVAEKMKKELNNWLESVQNSENEADYD